MRIHELGADVETLERGPDEIGADPIMLVGSANIKAPLLFTGAAAGEDAVRIDLRIPAAPRIAN
jgi:hypothetical protein